MAGATPAHEALPGKPSAVPPSGVTFKREEDFGAQLMRVGAGLVIALGVGAAALLGYKRLAPTPPGGRRMRLVETLRRGQQVSLFLVELDGKTLLIGQYGKSLAVL